MKYIYLLKGTNGFYKIGMASNLTERLYNINTANPDAIHVVAAKAIENTFEFEQQLHRKYDAFKTKNNGEWFDLKAEDAIDICIEINKAKDITIVPINKEIKELTSLLSKNHREFLANHQSVLDEIDNIKKGLATIIINNMPVKEANKIIKGDIPKNDVISAEQKSEEKPKEKSKRFLLNDDEEIYQKAKEVIIQHNTASASFLQRKLSIGYARAARILDVLEQEGFVSSGYPRIVMIQKGTPEADTTTVTAL